MVRRESTDNNIWLIRAVIFALLALDNIYLVSNTCICDYYAGGLGKWLMGGDKYTYRNLGKLRAISRAPLHP